MNRTMLDQLARTIDVQDEQELDSLLGRVAKLAAATELDPAAKRLLAGFPALIQSIDGAYERLREELDSRAKATVALRRTIGQLLGEGTGLGEEEDLDPRGEFERVVQLVSELVSASAAERNQLDNLRFALDQHAIVSIADTDGTITYANDRMCAASGYRRSEIIGSTHRMFKSGRHPPSFYADLWLTVSSGQVWNGEICNRNRDGDLVWFASTIVPMLDAGGLPTSYISIRTDITSRKKVEAELERARDQAQGANVAKSRFLATVSHELRTPLNGILGMAQLLKLGASEQERNEYTDTILTSGQILLNQLNDLLDFSKIEAGKMTVSLASFAPRELLGEVAALYSGSAGMKGIELRCEWNGEPAGRWRSDPQRLRQIVANLVSNAVKFTEAGSVVVRGRIDRLADGRHFLAVAVHDTGIGIARDDLERLFQPFQQLDDSNTRRFGGTGLGLSIVRSLVHLLQGTVNVESETGRGSTFHVRVPVEPAQDATKG